MLAMHVHADVHWSAEIIVISRRAVAGDARHTHVADDVVAPS
jgi:hypothetical protein